VPKKNGNSRKEKNLMSEEKVTYNACQGWGCHEHCTLSTYVRDGKIVRTERTVLKGSEAERYGICQRGIVMGKFPYIKERVLYPLKRVGKRGEGKFERISWEKALDEIGEKLNEIRDKYGPRSFIVNNFPCGYPNNVSGSLGIALSYGLPSTLDATLMAGPTIDMSVNYLNMIDFGDPLSAFKQQSITMEKANYIIIWGGNPIGYTRATQTSKILMDAQERGVKLVDVTPFYESTAAKVDEAVLIKPGTDAALALAMANVMIQEGLCDEDFLARYTVAPFLVRDDNGKFLRESDIEDGGDPEKYVVWNKVPAKPVSIAPHTFEYEDVYPELCVSVAVNGIPCKTAFRKLEERVAEWTPESQEKITGVAADTARRLVHEFVENKPATIFLNYGMRYMNGPRSARAVALLSFLSGNFGLKGGRLITGPLIDGHPVMLNQLPIMFPLGPENAKGGAVSMKDLLVSFENPNVQQYKAWLNCFSNPVQNWPDRKLWAEKIFPNMELIVVIEVRETDTAAFADYILPEATIFEREEIMAPIGDCIILNEPAIEPRGESKPPAYIYGELAKRLGAGEYLNKSTEEWLRIEIDTQDPAIAGLKPALTLDRLRQEKIVRLNVPEEPFDCWDKLDFETPSGRYEFYFEDLAEVDEALTKYIPPQIHSPKRAKYPLQFVPGRHRVYMQGQLTEIPELRAIGGKISTLAINPVDAAARGINNGDRVEIFNDKGSVQAVAHLSQVFPPGTVNIWYAYPSKDYPTNPPTVLSTALGTSEAEDAFSIRICEVAKVRYETPMLSLLSLFGVMIGHETLWDDLCEVRKV